MAANIYTTLLSTRMFLINQTIQKKQAGVKPAGIFVSVDFAANVLSLSSSHSYELIDGRHQSLLI